MQYKVKSLYLSGKGNKVLRNGDLVTEAQLSTDADQLVKDGFIEPYVGEAPTDEQPTTAITPEETPVEETQEKPTEETTDEEPVEDAADTDTTPEETPAEEIVEPAEVTTGDAPKKGKKGTKGAKK